LIRRRATIPFPSPVLLAVDVAGAIFLLSAAPAFSPPLCDGAGSNGWDHAGA
jgi:hypothetical protein